MKTKKNNKGSETERGLTDVRKKQISELSQAQKETAAAINNCWRKLLEQGYKAYNIILFIGIAFEIKKDENDNFYLVPNDLSNSDIYKRNT